MRHALQRFLDWWNCKADMDAIAIESMGNALEYVRKETDELYRRERKIIDEFKEREKLMVEAHRKCHARLSEMLEKQQQLTVDAYKRLEAFADEIRKADRTVEADRLMEAADTLLWALEGRVGNFYYERRANFNATLQ